MSKLHSRRFPVLGAALTAIAATAALSFAAAAVAADQPTDQVGRTYSGEPIQQMQLTQRVSYRDLNLSTPAGVAALKRRIRYTARAACQQLTSQYSLALWRTSNADCVNDAIQSAMSQVPLAVASAEQAEQAQPPVEAR
jgi:UrcA family protein